MSLRIGITIGLRSADETLWNNGIKQNAVFLADALARCPQTQRVVLVNTTDIPITRALPWDLDRWPTASFADVKEELDILIELGGQIDAMQTAYIKERGCKLVSYCCGFEYIHALQAVLFDRPVWGESLFVNTCYDDIWMIPQVEANSRGFFETLRRRPARVVPFVWNPVFLEQRSQSLPNAGCRRAAHGQPQRLVVMEPNIDVVKFCLYPILIVEEVYRLRPHQIDRLVVTNAERAARANSDFIALMKQLDIVQAHKAVFVGRYDTPQFISEHADIVVSHQWSNPLNYFYLEVCWQGYPLVHNASLCADLGFYYPDNDVPTGVARTIDAMNLPDEELLGYRDMQRSRIQRFLSSDPGVVCAYAELLDGLVRSDGR